MRKKEKKRGGKEVREVPKQRQNTKRKTECRRETQKKKKKKRERKKVFFVSGSIMSKPQIL